jgi:aminoglycoside/choline kinase family phosphotransferase
MGTVSLGQELATEERVRRAVSRATGVSARDLPASRLAGHASARSYWRVGPAGRSHVVMVMLEGARPDEVTKDALPQGLPFVNVQRYLKRIGVRVPEILAWYEQDHLLVLEDLGDATLRTLVLGGAPLEPLYEKAIDQLAWMHAAAGREPDPDCIAFHRSFDYDLLHWELMHFVEWGIQQWKGRRLSSSKAAVVGRHFDAICRTLEAEPKVFTHRDYQSRNLLVLDDGQQVVIDFQDALLGPRAYDLVALLRDSGVPLPQPFIDRMLRRYLDRLASLGGPRIAAGAFRASFDLLTVQRKLKDAGRYVFLERAKGKDGFLEYAPIALGYVAQAFARRPDLAELHEVLAAHVPELVPS